MDLKRVKIKGWAKLYQADGNNEKICDSSLISDKVEFRQKNIKWGYFIMLSQNS